MYYAGDWLEVLGWRRRKTSSSMRTTFPCLGWAFGIGFRTHQLLLFHPDIRLFLVQGRTVPKSVRRRLVGPGAPAPVPTFSKYLPASRMKSFPAACSSALPGRQGSERAATSENDVMEVIRNVAGDTADSLRTRLVDAFTHPQDGQSEHVLPHQATAASSGRSPMPKRTSCMIK